MDRCARRWAAHDICAVLVRGGRTSAAARFRALFSQAAAGIGIISMSGLVVDGNDTWARQMGYPIEEMRGRALRDLFVPGTEPLALMRFLELLEGVRDSFRLELTHVRRDGRRYVLDLSMSRVHVDDAEPDFLVGIALDVTDRKRFEEKLWHEARHDPLTGLPNRTMFFERLRAALGGPDRSAPVGLCHVDLDGFKSVNDGLGHDVGDRLLVRVADRLREALTAPGTLLARLGGDEFGVVVDGTHGATAAEQAQLVLEVLAAPFTIDRHELALSASVGVADSTAVGADGRELMRAADVGLYRAKARGRGRVEVHDPRGDAQRVTHHVLATEMAAALAHGELFLEYQPLVTLADDTTRRVEALPRWRHPRLGLVPPDRLVELAQETGHTGALGRWVLTDACRTAARWRAGRPGRRSASTWTSPSASSTTPTCRRRWRRSWPRPACRRSCRTWRSPRAPCSARCRVPPTPWSGWRASVSGSSSTASAPGTRTWRAWPGCRSPS